MKDPVPYYKFLKDHGVSDVNKCMFGQWLGFLNSTDYFDNVFFFLNNEKPKNKKEFLDHLNTINSIRIAETHQGARASFDESSTSKEITIDAENHLKLFLKRFKLIGDQAAPILNKFDTVNIQKLNGEVQLYESLFEVLTDDSITNLDVTYFAHKIPRKSEDAAINEYWTRTREMLSDGKLKLRRVVSVDDADTSGMKLLWILFNMVPKVYDQLGKGIYLNLFRTSNQVNGNGLQEGVCLQNMILMYNKRDPDKGHVWLFPGHQTGNQEQEYIHLYGSNNIMLFQKIYNNLFNTSMPIDNSSIKALLTERKKTLSGECIEGFIEKVFTKKDQLELHDLDIEKVKAVYSEIFNDGKKEQDGIW
jgi:hypothetical protein